MSLGEFLKWAASDRGPWNCSTLPADWCLTLGHPDFAAEWRDVIEPAACDETAAAGLVPLWERGIGDALPVVEAEGLLPGDIAVVRCMDIEVGVIFTGARFAIQAARGLHLVAADGAQVLKAWRP